MKEVYDLLKEHLSGLGYPIKDGLNELLMELFTPEEAEVMLALPTDTIPLQMISVGEIKDRVDLPKERLVGILGGLAGRGLLNSARMESGEKGYALPHRSFGGIGQAMLWKGENTPYIKKMADMLEKYYAGKTLLQSVETKTRRFQFIPIDRTIGPQIQAVYPYVMLKKVVEQARSIAVAHCACRVRGLLQGHSCDYPLEVCLKFDEMAEHLIENEFGREITKEEALDLIRKAEEAGLVHFVDNALGEIKHNCNCCGCHCWALNPIKERSIPRDVIMATYFIRETDEKECIGCGECVKFCPVDALQMEDDIPVMDTDWCIGCGVCATKCPTSAAKIISRSEKIPHESFRELHEKIFEEKQALRHEA